MELKLNEHELNYITSVIEQNLEQLNGTELDDKYTEMLENLYSKLIVLTKNK